MQRRSSTTRAPAAPAAPANPLVPPSEGAMPLRQRTSHGPGAPAALNLITDVAGLRVGQAAHAAIAMRWFSRAARCTAWPLLPRPACRAPPSCPPRCSSIWPTGATRTGAWSRATDLEKSLGRPGLCPGPAGAVAPDPHSLKKRAIIGIGFVASMPLYCGGLGPAAPSCAARLRRDGVQGSALAFLTPATPAAVAGKHRDGRSCLPC
jgi:hypothetical protein